VSPLWETLLAVLAVVIVVIGVVAMASTTERPPEPQVGEPFEEEERTVALDPRRTPFHTGTMCDGHRRL